MKIGPGTCLAHYKISAHLGAGAMGEVWRATDTKLARDVAIKVLPSQFTSDQERLERFEREARVLASLDHSNIASIHGFEDVEGSKFLVMQLAAGEDLSARLARGAIPLPEALPIARLISEGLNAAHERGVVHRDLKPANIRVDDDGQVKILDFGIAWAMQAEPGNADVSGAETLAPAATEAGVILGTPAYMSPEQARGGRVDKRTDIWAFGVVMWEMLTGQQLFAGESLSDTLAAVLTREIALDSLPKATPVTVRRLIGRCLDRNPKRRLRDISEATLVLEAAIDGDEQSTTPITQPASGLRRSAIAGWAVAAILVAVLVARTQTAPEVPVPALPAMQLEVVLSEDEVLSQSLGAAVVVSPDGSLIVYVAGDSPNLTGTARATSDRAQTGLYLRRLHDLVPTPIRGTEGAVSPFFSPDGQWIAFFSDKKLKKVDVSGGTPMTLCDALDARGGAWGRDVIVFAPGTAEGLSLVSPDGGEPRKLTDLDAASGERSHRWPSFLPNGHSVVFTAQRRNGDYEDGLIKIVDTRDGSVTLVGERGAYPRVAPTGHLMWVRGGSLVVAPFDLVTMELRGLPRPAIDNLMSLTVDEAMDDGTAQYDFSSTGLLVYRTGGTVSRQANLLWVDRSGNAIARGSHPDHYESPRISPDGGRVALKIMGQTNDLWIWDHERDVMSRFTFRETSDNLPIWSPDGSTIVFVSRGEGGRQELYSKASDGTGEARLLASSTSWIQPSSWSADGRTIFGQQQAPNGTRNIFALDIIDGVAGELEIIVSSPGSDQFAELSPDGKWIVYMSNETGKMLVYLRAYPGTGGKWQVSPTSGFFPRWTRNGTEIVFLETNSQMVAIDIDTSSGAPKLGKPALLFEGSFIDRIPNPSYDVSADGNRFLMLVAENEDEVATSNVMLITDWFERLRAIAPID